jgi:hypothetical protein
MKPYETEAKIKSDEYKEEIKEYVAAHPEPAHKPEKVSKSTAPSTDVTIPTEQLEQILSNLMELKATVDQFATTLEPLMKHTPTKKAKRVMESEASADEGPAPKKKKEASEYKKQVCTYGV